MELFLISGVIVLVALAIIDLVVGVGNDAVNFLNSAIGSKVANFRTIMWVATAGIFIGAMSSAGMMEIAREGIFNPEYFSLENVMVIFLAVMLTDILLLDAFNTLGLPTSTTVSIIFELLGASIIVSASMVMSDNLPLNYLFNINNPDNGIIGLINWNKTNTIISSIFLSVLIAFSFGVLVMWISRIIFSFNYRKRLKITGVIWSSLAMVALTYFLVYKGLKSTYSTEELTKTELISYIKSINPNAPDTINNDTRLIITDVEGQEMVFNLVVNQSSSSEPSYEVFFGSAKIKQIVTFIKDNLWWFLSLFLIFWVVVFGILHRTGYNPLKIVVFAGTFSLAMAFAGNDLVNFIGVPLAGYQSYELFQMANIAAGGHLSADTYLMSGLKFPIKTPYIYLMLCGIIMILTLWFSKKSRNVTETEVKLGSQDETDEKFSSNKLSRSIVRGSLYLSQKLDKIIPLSVSNKINAQFIPIVHADDVDAPAFDLVRASVNLTLASMLIALGTSYKLPLSTTYVTFMVAMGTSLADRAWGRESATYRIAGVINVIGGWLVTAIVAFCSAAIIAVILLQLQLVGLIIMIITLIGFILFTSLYHKKSENKKIAAQQVIHSIDLTTDRALQKSGKKIAESITIISNAYSKTITGLLEENQQNINDAQLANEQLLTFYSDIKNNLFKAIKKSKLNEKQTAQLYILSNDLMQDILQSLGFIITAADNHVKNAHKPLTEGQAEIIKKIEIAVVSYLNTIANALEKHDYDYLTDVKSNKRSIFDTIENTLSQQVDGISKKEYGFKNTDLVLNLLLETKDLVAISVRFAKLLQRLTQGESPLGNR
ncbi:MAG: inorganic phosphate transporter [Saprospiraceae bacterium]|nr:inorganic phosphate transporter [Saprospiraceae bacterium]